MFCLKRDKCSAGDHAHVFTALFTVLEMIEQMVFKIKFWVYIGKTETKIPMRPLS